MNVDDGRGQRGVFRKDIPDAVIFPVLLRFALLAPLIGLVLLALLFFLWKLPYMVVNPALFLKFLERLPFVLIMGLDAAYTFGFIPSVLTGIIAQCLRWWGVRGRAFLLCVAVTGGIMPLLNQMDLWQLPYSPFGGAGAKKLSQMDISAIFLVLILPGAVAGFVCAWPDRHRPFSWGIRRE